MALIQSELFAISPRYTNESPILFSAKFYQVGTFPRVYVDMNNLRTVDVYAENGRCINTRKISSTEWRIETITDEHRSDMIVTLNSKTNADTPVSAERFEAALDVFTRGFNAIKPRATIIQDGVLTDNKYIKFRVEFDDDVTGLTADGISCSTDKCSVYDISGSGQNYVVTLLATETTEVSIQINDDACSDIYSNTSKKSNIASVRYDSTPATLKSEAVNKTVDSADILDDFYIEELEQVAAINALVDCTKNIPQRLLGMAQAKLFDIAAKNESVQKLAGAVIFAEAAIETISDIAERVHAVIEHPETLMAALLEAQGLTGAALAQKMQYIADTFGNVSGLNGIIAAALESGICGQPNYYADGTSVPKQILTPTNMTPPIVPGVSAGAVSTYNSSAKDAYDEFAFKLKESLEIDDVSQQDPDRAAMLSIVTTLAMGYHDDVSKTIDASKDAELLSKYKANADLERQKNLGWSAEIKNSYNNRTTSIGDEISRNTQVIRNFYNRNTLAAGTLLSVGVTTYSGPAEDFTTYLDIKPEQRPPELTAKYQAQGRRIPTGSTYTNSAGKTFKIGTLDYAEAFQGAYGPIVSDRTCASTRVPGGSVLAMRNPDGTAYDPTGKNPSGQYTVMDTGNAQLTYKKPDIYTTTPNMYTNTGSVQVYLVSKGTQKKSQYKLAQRTYGGTTVA